MSERSADRKYPPADRWQSVAGATSVLGKARAVLYALALHADQATLIAWPSMPTLALESGLSEDSVRRALRELADLGAITVLLHSAGGVGHTNRYRVNLDTASIWAHVGDAEPPHAATVKPSQAATVEPPHVATVPPDNPSNLRLEPSQAASQTLAACEGNRGIEQRQEQKQGRRACSLPDLETLPDWVDREAWAEWREHRKQMKKPLTLLAEQKGIAVLQKCIQDGYTQRDVIDRCIAGGYQGLFAPSQSGGRRPAQQQEARHVAIADY